MADRKQVLVVDDHFEMLEFLRSMLELANRDCQVLGVPSAEEGFYELRRTPFDLVITDLRLPGMSGFELVRKIKQHRPELPIIMITGYSSDQGRQEARELGVFRYFQKPLDTDELLAAVRAALYGATAATVAAPSGVAETGADLRRRLEALRADTGAQDVLLATRQGALLYDSGNKHGHERSRLLAAIVAAMQHSFALAEHMGGGDPFMIQYLTGRLYDLYWANIGRDYFLAMFFDSQSRRGRIGTVWVFAQRAIRELAEMLAVPLGRLDSAPAAEPARRPRPATMPTQPPPPARPAAPPPIARPVTPVQVTPPVGRAPQPGADTAKEADSSPPAIEPPPDELRRLLELDFAASSAASEAEAFWNEAISESNSPDNSQAMGLDEARCLGLISFDPDTGEK
jgi:DNA-binding response OmpR family regulator